MSSNQTGTVRWFDPGKGFGFIVNEMGIDVFAHYRNMNGTGFKRLKEGQKVSFTVEDGDRGLKALDIEVISEPDYI